MAQTSAENMKKFARGLIVGKFSPLHLGHDFLIRTALGQCQELVLMAYSNPEFLECLPEKREGWLRKLYPLAQVFVINEDFMRNHAHKWGGDKAIPLNSAPDDEHRDFVAKIFISLVGQPLDAVFTSENYGDGFAKRLSEKFSACGLQQVTVQHILADPERRNYPVSGTKVREEIHASRHLLPPEVYCDFVKSVCLIGAESTGKSTLAALMAEKLKTTFADEYGRTLWEEQRGVLTFGDFMKIAVTQIQKETAARISANRFFFADTSPLTTLFYCREYHGKVAAELEQLSFRNYDYTFLCMPDFPLVQDGTRMDEKFRTRQHEWYVQMLAKRNIKYDLLRGNLASRCDQILERIR